MAHGIACAKVEASHNHLNLQGCPCRRNGYFPTMLWFFVVAWKGTLNAMASYFSHVKTFCGGKGGRVTKPAAGRPRRRACP